MNTKILELIAAQMGSGGQTRVAELMARLRTNSGDGAALDPKELLARMGEGNPIISSFLKQMAAQQEGGSQASVIDVEPLEKRPELMEAPAEEPDDSTRRELEELQQRAGKMSAELKVLRERNDLLAAALGACCLCWGQDLGCRSCRGRGGPGFCIPDEELFGEYVVPAVRTLRAQKARVRNFTPGAQPRITETEAQMRSAANY